MAAWSGLTWLMLQMVTEGKKTWSRDSVVEWMVVTTVLWLKSEAAVKMKKEAIMIEAHTIITQICRQGELPVKIYLKSRG